MKKPQRSWRRSVISIRVSLLLSACILSSPTWAQGDPCFDNTHSVRAADICLTGELTQAQALLDVAVKVALSHSDQKHKDLLKNAQADWLIYIEAECDVKGDTSRGGTAYSETLTVCELEKYRDRIKEIKDDYNFDNAYGDSTSD